MPQVNDTKHPEYKDNEENFKKWRLTMQSGDKYKEEFLTARTNEVDFQDRFDISYVPAFAKEAVLEVSRAIHQRLPRVQRSGGTGSFLTACKGKNGGVDRRGSTMNSFISRNVVEELCFLGSVGIFVDNITPQGALKSNLRANDHPYLYAYKREDIKDWAYDQQDPNRLKYVVLVDHIDVFDEKTGLRDKVVERYRHAFLNESGQVVVRYYDEGGKPLDENLLPATIPYDNVLDLTAIPFALASIGSPLVADVADHQIAHMTLASLDMNFATRSNIPFYTEQRAPFGQDMYAQRYVGLPKDEDGNEVDPQDLTEDTRKKYLKDQSQILIGATLGRTYPTNVDRPGFIHPSTEPLRASMEKQETLKAEIRELVALSLKQAGLRFQSESSKKMDDQPMEAGLSYIGLVIEALETTINHIWAEYESAKTATIKYPETYNLMTETERRAAIKEDKALMSVVPSSTFRLQMQKSIVATKFGHVLDPEIVAQMEAEIDTISAPTSDPEEIRSDVEAGLLSAELGSKIRGYPEGEATKAQQEKAARLNIATRLQNSAHINPDAADSGTIAAANEAEKQTSNDADLRLEDTSRGKGKQTDE